MKKSEQKRRREAKAKSAKKLPEPKHQNIGSPIAVKTGRVEDDSQTTINPDPEENKKRGEKQTLPRGKAKRMSLMVSAIFISILFAVALVVASKGGSPTRILWWSVAAVIFAEIGIGFLIQAYVIEPREAARAAARAKSPIPTPTDRPWLSVEVVPSGPLLFSQSTPNLSVKFIIKNEGQSVANDVTVRAQAFIAEWGDTIFIEPVKRQTALCGNAKNESVGSEFPQETGMTVFPNQTGEIFASFGLNRKEMETNRIELIKGKRPVYGIVPVLVGCIDYAYGDKPFHGRTGFIFRAQVFDPAYPHTPYAIRIGNDVPADRLLLLKYGFGGDYAN